MQLQINVTTVLVFTYILAFSIPFAIGFNVLTIKVLSLLCTISCGLLLVGQSWINAMIFGGIAFIAYLMALSLQLSSYRKYMQNISNLTDDVTIAIIAKLKPEIKLTYVYRIIDGEKKETIVTEANNLHYKPESSKISVQVIMMNEYHNNKIVPQLVHKSNIRILQGKDRSDNTIPQKSKITIDPMAIFTTIMFVIGIILAILYVLYKPF